MRFVSEFKDRHGKTRYRFRRNGVCVYICEPGHPDFGLEYEACMIAAARMADLRQPKPDLPLVTQARNYLAAQALKASGYVYFVRGGVGRMKIGYTTDPVQRFGSLRTNCPDKLTLLGLVPGSKSDERAWHEQFSDHHISGEWYRSTEQMKRKIRAAKTRTLVNIG